MDHEETTITADRIEARYIALVDDHGVERAALFVSDVPNYPPSTVIRIMGADGLPKLELQVDGVHPGIRLSTPQQATGISLAVNDIANGIMIADNEGRPIFQCGMYHDPTHGECGSQPRIALEDHTTGLGWEVIAGEEYDTESGDEA